MRYYRLENGLSSRETEVYVDDIENEEYKRLRPSIFRCEPIKKWPNGLFAICNGCPENYDVLPGMYKRVYVSRRAMKVLGSIAGFPAQFLPVRISETEASSSRIYFMMHVIAVCSSLNMKKTRYENSSVEDSDKKSIIIAGKNKKTITLSQSKLKSINHPIFCEKGCESLLILREDLIDYIEKAELKGLKYEEVRID